MKEQTISLDQASEDLNVSPTRSDLFYNYDSCAPKQSTEHSSTTVRKRKTTGTRAQKARKVAKLEELK